MARRWCSQEDIDAIKPLVETEITEYFEEKGVLQLFQELTAGVFRELPTNPYEYMQARLDVVEPGDRLP